MRIRNFAAAALAVAAVASPRASAQFHLSELLLNPPGTDNGQEAIEIVGPASTALTGWSLVIIEGDGTGAGVVDVVLPLDAFSTGADGILLLRDAATVIAPGPCTTAVFVNDFAPDIENGSNTYLLGNGTPPAATTDLDSDNDGTLNAGALAGFTVSDGVTILENDGAANVGYADDLGFAVLGPFAGPVPDAHTPDAAYRLFDTGGSPATWLGGDVAGTNPGGPYAFAGLSGEVFGFPCIPAVDLALSLGCANGTLADGDNDGCPDFLDGCASDINKTAPGLCGCGIAEGCTLGIDINAIDASDGGAQTLKLFAGAVYAGQTYFILGNLGLSGTAPGLTFPGGVNLPLNYDFYTQFLLTAPNTIILLSNAQLDVNGEATAVLTIPPVAIPFAVTLNHAYIVLNAFNKVIFASNAAPVLLNP